MIQLAVRMYHNWLTDHAIDHSSIGLNRLMIQLVFNEVSLFTFSNGTHGFEVTVPKNYLNSPRKTDSPKTKNLYLHSIFYRHRNGAGKSTS